MKTCSKTPMLVVLFFLLIFFALGGLASQPAEIPPGHNSVAITVLKEDPADPSGWSPVSDMVVKVFSASEFMNYADGVTRSDGTLTLDGFHDGYHAVFLPYADESEHPVFATHMLDVIRFVVKLDPVTRHQEVTLRLPLKQEGTGGARLQAVYYPHQYNENLNIPIMDSLMEYSGPNVAGIEYIIGMEGGSWLMEDGTTTTDPQQAKRYITDDSGQVLILGLAPGDYVLGELNNLPGNLVQRNWDEVSFTVYENTILPVDYDYGGLLYVADLHSTGVMKMGEDNLIAGAQFVVYRLGEDGKPLFLRYETGLIPGQPVIASYTPYQEQAHVFISRVPNLPVLTIQDSFSFLVHGQMSHTDYYFREIAPPPGYLPLEEDVHDRIEAWNPDDFLASRIIIENKRDEAAILVHKVPANIYDSTPPDWLKSLPGTEFVLARANFIENQPEPVSISFLTSNKQGEVFWNTLSAEEYFNGYPKYPEDPESTHEEWLAYEAAILKYHRTLARDFVFKVDAVTGSFAIPDYGLLSGGERLLTPGSYGLFEVANHPGFSGGSYEFDLSEGSSLPTLTVDNYFDYYGLYIQKTDATGNETLPGAQFIIEGSLRGGGQVFFGPNDELVTQREEAKVYETDEYGVIHTDFYTYWLSGLDHDQPLLVHEVAAPDGFFLPSGQPLTIIEQWHPRALNDPDPQDIYHSMVQIRNQKLNPMPVNILAKKQLVNGTLAEGAYQFELLKDGQVIATASNDAAGNIVFEQVWLVPDLAGYKLQVREVIPQPADPAIAYDRGIKEINVRFYQQTFEFPIKGRSPMPEGAYLMLLDKQPPVFVNTLVPPEPSYATLRVPISARKELRNGRLQEGQFTFELADAAGKVIATATNAADGSVQFPDRTFSRVVSNYLYTVREQTGTQPRMHYDQTVYKVWVTTTAQNGRLTASVAYEKDGTPYDGEMVFINRLELPPTGDGRVQYIIILLSLSAAAGSLALLTRRRRENGRG